MVVMCSGVRAVSFGKGKLVVFNVISLRIANIFDGAIEVCEGLSSMTSAFGEV